MLFMATWHILAILLSLFFPFARSVCLLCVDKLPLLIAELHAYCQEDTRLLSAVVHLPIQKCHSVLPAAAPACRGQEAAKERTRVLVLPR